MYVCVCIYYINCLRAKQTLSELYLIIRVTERSEEVRGGNPHTHTKLVHCEATPTTATSCSPQSQALTYTQLVAKCFVI